MTIVRQAENDYYIVTAGAAHAYDQDFLYKAIADKEAEFGRINEEDVTAKHGVFAIAGPKSRDVLRSLVVDPDPETALSNKRFPWLSARRLDLKMCPTMAIRVAYTGELGWELHHPMEMQNYLFDLLMEAGEPHGLKLCGARAQNWLRQEKSYRAFGSDLGRDATPLESGLDRFVDMTKDFKGKAAMVETGVRAKCVTVLIDGPEDADPLGPRGAGAGWPEGRAADLGRVLGRVRQADRHRLCPPGSGRHRTEAAGPDAARVVERRNRRGQPLRPEERDDPPGRLSLGLMR